MAILKYKDANGNFVALSNYTVQPITPVQETGSSTTDIMSQNAVTTALNTKANTSDVYSKTDADSVFLTQESARNTYLSQTNAESTFLTKNDATNNYLTKTDASNTYQTSQQVKNIVNKTVYGTETPSVEQTGASVVTTGNLDTTLSGYQKKLTAGNGISIENNVINCTVDLSLFKVVDNLPTSGIDVNKIYLVKSATEGPSDIYTEYMYVNGKWETFGTFKTDVDLTGYLTKELAESTYQPKGDYALASAIPSNNNQLTNGAGYQTAANVNSLINTALGAYSTTSAIETNYAKKATTIAGYGITDAKIQNGSIILGANSITPLTEVPSEYVTETELAGKGYATTSALTSGLSGKSDTNHTHNAATTSASGFMSVSDKTKLDGLKNYSLPTASASVLGGVKVGTNLSIDSNGVLSATDTTYTLGSFGITATAAELNYCDGVTSNIQTQLNGKASTSVATPSANGLLSSSDKAWIDFMNGSTTGTNIASVPVTKHLCVVTISADGSFELASTPAAGREVHVIVKNTSSSDITISMPRASAYVNMSGDSLTVAGNGYADINVISDGTNMYVRAL